MDLCFLVGLACFLSVGNWHHFCEEKRRCGLVGFPLPYVFIGGDKGGLGRAKVQLLQRCMQQILISRVVVDFRFSMRTVFRGEIWGVDGLRGMLGES